MATEVTAPSSDAQYSASKELNDSVCDQLVKAVSPGDAIISVSFVAARDLYGNDFEPLKASMAEHFSQHFKTPIREVKLSVNLLANNLMATPVKHNSPVSVTDSATPSAEHDTEDEVMIDADATKAKKKVPRPPNAFIIYRKDWHSTVVAENPGLHNNAISVIIGKKWKKESQSVREKYQRKAAEAKHHHLMANPGYQYQPRKPSEKKKRMTKNKIAKLAAKSAAAKPSASLHNMASGVTDDDMLPPAQVAPMLTFNENKNTASFFAGSGTSDQLIAELTAFNNSKWTPAQQAAYRSGPTIPPVMSTEVAAGSYTMDSIMHHPLPTSTPNIVPCNTDAFALSAEDFFDEDATRASSYYMPDLEDMNVVLPRDNSLDTSEVLRQLGLAEEFKDGLNDFFDFDRFD